MNTLWIITGLTITWINSVLGYHSCYECSDKSALCREAVYDGQYLSRTQCTTACFLRMESTRIYRGCFDGWVGGMVDHSYVGCKTQEYYGEKVEWCFCQGNTNDEEPCNAASQKQLTKLNFERNIYDNKNNDKIYVNINEVYDSQTDSQYNYFDSYQPPKGPIRVYHKKSQFKKSKEYKQQAAKIERLTSQRGKYLLSEEKPIDDPPKYTEKNDDYFFPKKINCYSCHDTMLECQDIVGTNTHHIAKQTCATKCFVRKDRGKLYRGCYDGWQTTKVRADYVGCRTQIVNGRATEWCFCKTDLCNIESMYHMKTLDPYAMPYQVTNKPHSRVENVVHHYYGEKDDNEKQKETDQSYVEVLHLDHSAIDTPIIGLCHGQRDGIYPDPYDCHQFIHCYHGYTYRRQCPPGTMWNIRYGNCGHKADITSDKCELRDDSIIGSRGHELPKADDKLSRLVEEVLAGEDK